MRFNWRGTTRELMMVQRPSGTHLSQSSTPGGMSTLARNDNNTLVTHAVLFSGNRSIVVIAGVSFALGIATVMAAPHVKNGMISLKSKLSRPSDETTDETPGSLAVVAEIEPERSDAPRLRAV